MYIPIPQSNGVVIAPNGLPRREAHKNEKKRPWISRIQCIQNGAYYETKTPTERAETFAVIGAPRFLLE